MLLKLVKYIFAYSIAALCFIACDNENSYDDAVLEGYDIEIDEVLHSESSISYDHFKGLLNETNSELTIEDFERILLFITNTEDCSNCINEIVDYQNILESDTSVIGNYVTILYYHGSDSLASSRYIKASGIKSKVHYSSFIEENNRSLSYILKQRSRYSMNGRLFLINQKYKIVEREFILPIGKTTKLSSKCKALKSVLNR